MALCGVLVGCEFGKNPDPATALRSGSGPIQVIATVGMVADLVRQVGGSEVNVRQICGPGVDPHLYKATRDDVLAIMSADIVFHCGLMLEGKLADTLQKVGETRPVVAVAERLDRSRLLEPEGFSGHFDPHVWMDVATWSECLPVIAETLAAFDPDHSADYRNRAAQSQQALLELHQYGQEVMATIPQDRRVLVTSHDAFNYFGQAYHIEVLGIQGLSTESESGLQRINELVDLLVNRQVSAVFVESSVPRKNVEALIEGSRSRGHQVQIGGELFSDAMGPEGTYTGTYIGMMDHNLTTVAVALGGMAPPEGYQGRFTTTSSVKAE